MLLQNILNFSLNILDGDRNQNQFDYEFLLILASQTEIHIEYQMPLLRNERVHLAMLVESEVFFFKSMFKIPLNSPVLSIFQSTHLSAGFYEVLHFHLLKLTGAENKISWSDFVSECFSNLSNSKRNFSTSCQLERLES